MYFFFSASEPERMTGSEPSLFTAGIREEDAQTRATSSITMTVASASAAGAAVLLGDVHGVQVVGDERVEGLTGEAGLLVHRGGVRRDLRLGQRADGVPEHVVLLGRAVQVEVSRSGQGLSRSKTLRCWSR